MPGVVRHNAQRMNWRWLIMDYVDPKLGLTFEQRRDVRWHVRTRTGFGKPKPSGYWKTFVFALVPAMALILVLLPLFLFDMHWRYALVVIPAQVIITWLAMALVGRWALKPFVIDALRHYGYDVCERCGYDLRGLPDDAVRCSECGEIRAKLQPGRSEEQAATDASRSQP